MAANLGIRASLAQGAAGTVLLAGLVLGAASCTHLSPGSETAEAREVTGGSEQRSATVTRAPGPLPASLPSPEPGNLLFAGEPFVTSSYRAVPGAGILRSDASDPVPFRIEEGEGVVLLMEGAFDHPRMMDEEMWETLAVWIPSRRRGRYGVAASGVAYSRSTAWVRNMVRARDAEGVVEVLDEGGKDLLVSMDLKISTGRSEGGAAFVVRRTLRFPVVALEEVRRR